ncbi:peroxidase-related enzyme [Microbacterium suwonense]|uniref:Alkyl hydroperoxide reductase AhpD n=1 Tax=Microbacterium suwonense TaxID=683047 RepID=A0ABM8FUI0_9MICO|nr:peroxidase-related enzyme [Microbacterium suwonense]BDZ39128.1 alkyl hydroperoxide reductase AhpD [Microbacterium suwonense]
MSTHFTTDERAWHAWIEPVGPQTGTPEQIQAYESSVWPDSPYFRLLAWHPAALEARTALDHAVFLARPGLRRGERELAATVASRLNGCELCTSVHSRFTVTFTRREDEVNRLLTEGVEAELDDRWRAITDAAAALTASPPRFGEHHVRALRNAGLSASDVHDIVEATAFFAWANRLMLSLGEPAAPSDEDAQALANQRAADTVARGQA